MRMLKRPAADSTAADRTSPGKKVLGRGLPRMNIWMSAPLARSR
jgi:hypothetical protein